MCSVGVGVHPSVSTPGSILSACTPMDTSLSTQFLSSTSPPMATTPTSQQMLSEVTTPADSIASPTSLLVNGFRFYTDDSQLPVDPYTAQGGNLLANLVADIQNMTNRMIVSPASTNENIIGHSENDNGEHSVMLSPLSPPEVGSADDRSSCQPPGKRSRAVQIGTSSTTSDIMSPPSQDLSMDCGFGLSQSTSFYSHDFPSQDDVVEIDQWTMASVSRRSTGASDTMSIPSVSSNSRRNSNTDSSSIWHPHRVGTPRYLNQRTTTSPSESRIDERHLELNFTQIL